MKERVIYNVYYQGFDKFKMAIIGFFSALQTLTPESALGKIFRSRVRDKFRAIKASATNF